VERTGIVSPVEKPVPQVKRVVPKRTKVGRYEFTDQQLEIAMRSLDAGDSV